MKYDIYLGLIDFLMRVIFYKENVFENLNLIEGEKFRNIESKCVIWKVGN